MLKSIVATLILAIVCTAGITAQATFKSKKHNQNGDRPTPTERAERITEKMTKKLELSDYQSDQVGDLNLNLANQISSIRKSEMTKDEKREEIKGLRTGYQSSISGILTPEQNEKWLQWIENRKNKREESGKRPHHGNRGKGERGGNR